MLLNSQKKIPEKSPGTRMFVTGRPHIQDEIEKRFSGRVATIDMTPRRSDIIKYLGARLDEDTTIDEIGSSLDEDIKKNIPHDISGMCVEAIAPQRMTQVTANRYLSRILLVSLNIYAILHETKIAHR